MVAVAPDTRKIDEIRFENLKRVNPKTAQAVLETAEGKPLEQEKLDSDLRRLYGTGDFERVNYRLVDEQSRTVLAVDAVEKTWGPNYLRFGIGLSTDFRGDAFFNVIGSYRRTWLNSLGAEWRTDLQVGRSNIVTSEFYQPLTPTASLFVAPRVNYTRRSANLFSGEDRIAIYDLTSYYGGIDLGSQLKRLGEFRIGALRGTARPKLDTGPLALTPGANSVIAQGAFTSQLLLDQQDSVHFPRSGWRGAAHVYDSNTHLSADEPYTKWDVDGSVAFSFDDHTFNFYGKAGGKAGSNPIPRYDMFSWGGFLQGSGLNTGQLYGQTVRYGRAMYYHRILRGSALFEGAYIGASFEGTKVGNPVVVTNPDGLIRSASLFFAVDTPLGPAYLAYGRTRDNQSTLYFYLGRPF